MPGLPQPMRLLLLGCVLALQALPFRAAIAAPDPAALSEVLRGSVLERLLLMPEAEVFAGAKNLAGVSAGSKRMGDAVKASVPVATPEFEKAANEIAAEIARLRAARVVSGGEAIRGALSAEEATLAERLARRRFSQVTESAETEEIAQALKRPQPMIERNLVQKARDLFKGMRECRAQAPAADARGSFLSFLGMGLVSDEVLTVGGYLSQTGYKNVNWGELSSDMVMAAILQARPLAMIGARSFGMRWFRMVFAGTAGTALDATIYQLSPLKNEEAPSTLKRASFNEAWQISMSSWLVPSMYEVTEGLSCLFGASKAVKIGNFAFYFVTDMGVTMLYFRERKQWIEPQETR